MGMEAKGAVRDFEVPSHVAYLSRSATARPPRQQLRCSVSGSVED